MSIPITRTKLIIPRRRADLLSRPRLLDMLADVLDYRLVVISAPAGYGKTSLLVDFAHRQDVAVCWLSLDEFDQDVFRLAAHLIASIQRVFPAFGENSTAFLESRAGEVDIPALVSVLVNDIYEHVDEHFVVVLDDYHLVDSSAAVNEFISRFGQEMDENCHLVISSRSLLSLPSLPLLIGRAQVKGFGMDELAFQPGEIRSLFEKKFQRFLTPEEAEQLITETGGWIAAVLMRRDPVPVPRSVSSGWGGVVQVDLYDYLAQQVLEQQPLPRRRFLMQTALLGEFNSRLCAEVLGEPPPGVSWEALLDEVVQSNLFVQVVEADGLWLRYHHLFADFLVDRYRREAPEEMDRQLERMVEVFSRQQAWEKAYRACRQRGDEMQLVAFLERAGLALLTQGQSSLLLEWLEQLPFPMLEEHPVLHSLRGAALIERGRPRQALEVLQEAEQHFDLDLQADMLTRNLVWQAAAARLAGNPLRGEECALRALSLMEKHPSLPRAVLCEARRELGLAFAHRGEVERAIELLLQARQGFLDLKNREDVARLDADLGWLYMNLGEWRRADEHYTRARRVWEESRRSGRLAFVLNNMGVLALQRGDYRQAEEHFRTALAYARRGGDVRMQAFVLAGLGDLFADLEALPLAQQFYQRSGTLAAEMDERALRTYLPIAQARLLRMQAAWDEARQMLIESATHFGSTSPAGAWLLEYGILQLFQGEVEAAVSMLEDALGVFSTGGERLQALRAVFWLMWAGARMASVETIEKYAPVFFEGLEQQDAFQPLVVDALSLAGELNRLQEFVGDRPGWRRLLKAVDDFERQIPQLRRELSRLHASITPAKTGLRIQSLGEARIYRDGQLVTAPEWANQRTVREIFYYLLAHSQGADRETLGREFWPHSEGTRLSRQVKNAVYRLRRALGKEAVLYDLRTGRYRFNRDISYRYDAEDFEVLIQQAGQAADEEEAMQYFERAVALYRGDYLYTFDGLWVEPLREGYRQMFIQAANMLAEMYFHHQRLEDCHRLAQRLLEVDACLETAHGLLMRVYARRGDRGAVARQYQQYCRNMEDVLGLGPSAAMEQLYRRLLEEG
ncbi:MAG: hypothetical protein D6803_01260 [Anaerolineae bacterium]|nr:MAG: hypothetical protein D6803_01260 [Anaerolineae bacterium]